MERKSIIVLFIVAMFIIPAFAREPFIWDFEGGSLGWMAVSQGTEIVSEMGNLVITEKTGQPFIVSPNFLSIIYDDLDTLVIRMRASESGMANVFWRRYNEQNFSRAKMQAFYLGKKGRFHNYYINLSFFDKDFFRRADQILLSPIDKPGVVEIDDIRVIKGNMITNMIAGHQEFFSPRGRAIIGSTINTIQSSTLFGRTIFFYIYWIIGIAFIVFLIIELIMWIRSQYRSNIIDHLKEMAYRTIIASFAFWVLLALNSLYNDWNILKEEFSKYAFKTTSQKMVAANTPGFYEFMEFCRIKLPDGVPFDSRIPPIYDEIKARYYLFPHEQQKGAEYIVVFNQAPEGELMQASSVYAKFNDNAYILKRRNKQ